MVSASLAPAVDAMLERARQAELVEADGPQTPDHAAYLPIDVARTLHETERYAMNLLLASAGQIADARGVERDRVQVLAQLIVQFARQMAALEFLRLQRLIGETPVVGKQAFGLLFQHAAAAQFAARLAIAAPCEPCKADGEHTQRARQFVELEALEAPRPAIRVLAEIECHA